MGPVALSASQAKAGAHGAFYPLSGPSPYYHIYATILPSYMKRLRNVKEGKSTLGRVGSHASATARGRRVTVRPVAAGLPLLNSKQAAAPVDQVVTSDSNSTQHSVHGSGISPTPGPDTATYQSRLARTRSRKDGHFAPEAPTKRHYDAVDDVLAGIPICQALPRNGFSSQQAKKGMQVFRSGPLRVAWEARFEHYRKQGLPSLEDRRRVWHLMGLEDMVARKNDAVPILRLMGQAYGTIAPEAQVTVAIAPVVAAVMPAGYVPPVLEAEAVADAETTP